MSLDKNLFTLLLTPNKDSPNVVDLVDPTGAVHYRKQRLPGNEYKIEVYDFMTQSLLITASAPSPASKVKSLELHNPTSVVELKSTASLLNSFKWSFKWEEHEFEWKREECFMIRKPDPPVIIAVTRETAGRSKIPQVQILDYNLNRFDIDDRKGLEIVILTALMTFHDGNESSAMPETPVPSSSAAVATTANAPPAAMGRTNTAFASASGGPPPPPPPKPAPKTGVDRIAELQAGKGDYNEIIVSEEGGVEEYAEYCNKLLQDDAMLFITLKTADANQVPKVLQVVQHTKRIRHKSGVAEEEELYQYVLYDQDVKKGPKRINLDDDPKNKYEPPKNLTVHLSKISMPELQPKADAKKDSKHDKRASTVGYTREPSRPAPPTPLARPPSQPTPGSSLKPPGSNNKPNKLQRPSRPTSPSNNTHRPNPSPSQLNNPSAYGNPQIRPPQNQRPPPQSRPPHQSPNRPPHGPGKPPSPMFPQPTVPAFGPAQPQAPAPRPPAPPGAWPPTNPPGPPPPIGGPGNPPAPGSSSSSSNPLSGFTNKPISASAVVSGLLDRLNRR